MKLLKKNNDLKYKHATCNIWKFPALHKKKKKTDLSNIRMKRIRTSDDSTATDSEN